MSELLDRTKLAEVWEQIWDKGNVDILDAIVCEDYVRLRRGESAGSSLDQVKAEILDIRQAFPDLTTTVDAIVKEDNTFAVFWKSQGTFTEALNGVPPTGAQVETFGCNLLTIEDNKIKREEATWDASELLSDLGLQSLNSAFEQHEVEPVTANFTGNPPQEAFKAFNRQFVTGVMVVTTLDEDGKPRGLAANSYNSISLDPPLISVCVQKTSSTYPALFKSNYMGLNIMSRDQLNVLGVFAAKGEDKFSKVDWESAPNGSPLLPGSSASIEVEIKERFQALTHTVFIGRVVNATATENEPLIYRAGRFYDSQNLTELS